MHDEQRDLVVVGAGVRSGALRAATAGQITTSPSSSGTSPGSIAPAVAGPVVPESGQRPGSTSSSSSGNDEHVGGAVARP